MGFSIPNYNGEHSSALESIQNGMRIDQSNIHPTYIPLGLTSLSYVIVAIPFHLRGLWISRLNFLFLRNGKEERKISWMSRPSTDGAAKKARASAQDTREYSLWGDVVQYYSILGWHSIFKCPKISDHIMPYRLPFVIFSDRAKIFFVFLLASHNRNTTMEKNLCLYVCPTCSLDIYWSVSSSSCLIVFTSIYGLFKRFPMGVFHWISVLTPIPLPCPPEKNDSFLQNSLWV